MQNDITVEEFAAADTQLIFHTPAVRTRIFIVVALMLALYDYALMLDYEASSVYLENTLVFRKDLPSLGFHQIKQIKCPLYYGWEVAASLIAVYCAEFTTIPIMAVAAGAPKSDQRLHLGPYVITPEDHTLLSGCYILRIKSIGGKIVHILMWLPSLVFETTLCAFMLYKAWTARYGKGSHDSLLIQIIIRDSITYFVTIFVVLLSNCLMWVYAPLPNGEVLLGLTIAVPSMMCSRLLLNMREAYFRTGDNRSRVLTHAPIEFIHGKTDRSAGSTSASNTVYDSSRQMSDH
ncbi:hypothetical protein BU17DRAFT_66498 [Hysterangium stoloniferum]|nr:hypothetical protein BU17DRAFT_66498 [Hysterangium stoloniferum]